MQTNPYGWMDGRTDGRTQTTAKYPHSSLTSEGPGVGAVSDMLVKLCLSLNIMIVLKWKIYNIDAYGNGFTHPLPHGYQWGLSQPEIDPWYGIQSVYHLSRLIFLHYDINHNQPIHILTLYRMNVLSYAYLQFVSLYHISVSHPAWKNL